jgi:hypothetical protein
MVFNSFLLAAASSFQRKGTLLISTRVTGMLLINRLSYDTLLFGLLAQGAGCTPTSAAAAAASTLSPATTPTAAGAAGGAETSPKRSKRQRLERLLRGRTRRTTSERRHASLSLPPSPGLLDCDIDAQLQQQPSMSPVARDSSMSPVPAAVSAAAQLSASVGGAAATPQQSPVNTGSRSARKNYRNSSKQQQQQQQPSPGPLSRLSLRSISPARERDSSAVTGAVTGTSTLTRRRGSDLFSSDGGGCDDDVDMQMMMSSVTVPIAGEAAKLSRRRRLRNFLTAKGYRSRPKKVKGEKNGRRFSLVSTLSSKDFVMAVLSDKQLIESCVMLGESVEYHAVVQ